MTELKQLGNYLLFEETKPDSIGKNFRTGEVESGKVKGLRILSEVHPVLYSNPKLWKRIVLLFEGIKKSNISGLYSPDKILTMGEKQMLVFPFLHYKNFDSILEDSDQKGIPINFDLAFSIAIAIADLLDVGSSIVISGKKSSHGFLTPDNILIDFEGKIYLKNYGIYPYLDKDEEIFSAMEKQYGSWLTPEFIRRESIAPQSDIYHLGYLLFKMLTGNYFSYSTGEDFESKLASISFSQHIHNTNKDYINGLMEFFKKTLHPDPGKRFSNCKEFKDFISATFHVEELSSVTFNLAYFMDSLYGKTRDEELAKFETEKKYIPPVKKSPSGSGAVDTQLVETILEGLDEAEKGGRSKIVYMIGAVLIVAVATIIFIVIQSGQAKKAELRKQEQARVLTEQSQRVKVLQDKLKEIEKQQTASAEEEKLQEEARQQLLAELEKEKKEKERLKKIEVEVQKKAEDEKIKKAEEEKKKQDAEAEKLRLAEVEKKKQEEIDRKKREEEASKPKPGELLPIQEVDKKPQKISGKSPVFAPSIRSKYYGNEFEARVMCLIDENGTIVSLRVLSNIPKELKKVIEKSVKKWMFTPATKKGVKVKVWHSVTLNISI